MRTEIRKIAEAIGYEITDWDIEQIMETKFHLLVNGYIENAIESYFKN